jgi:hypothetical protein
MEFLFALLLLMAKDVKYFHAFIGQLWFFG